MTIRKLYLTILLSICMLTGLKDLIGQSSTNSPYSRFGIGMLDNQKSNVISKSMGGIGQGVFSRTFINPMNPASYAAFDTLSFHFDGAVSASILSLKSANNSASANSGSVDYLTFGFPINRFWRASFGLLPFSNVTYDVLKVRDGGDNIGSINQIYNGSGGFNQVYIGSGFKVMPNLFVGFNAYYVFGSIARARELGVPEQNNAYETRVTEKLRASDYYFDFGVQYFRNLKDDLKLGMGATFSPQNQLSAKRDYFAYNFQKSGTGLEKNQDTIISRPEEKGNMKFPLNFGLGFSIEKDRNWMIGTDFTYANWKNYSSFGQSFSTIKDSWSFKVGGYWLPDNRSIANFLNRSIYRVGFHYGDSYYKINNQSIPEYGINFGVSFPFRKNQSSINLGIEYGGLGKAVDNLVKESYFKFSLGISIHEKWFVKYKYY
ncbi:MAG: hypothetical protein ACEPOW_02980 [Bacteroidales bacterium]